MNIYVTSSKAGGQNLTELFSQIPVPKNTRGCCKHVVFLRRSLLTWIFLRVLPLLPRAGLQDFPFTTPSFWGCG